MSATQRVDAVVTLESKSRESGPVICTDAAIGTTGTRKRASANPRSLFPFPCINEGITSERTSQCYPIPVEDPDSGQLCWLRWNLQPPFSSISGEVNYERNYLVCSFGRDDYCKQCKRRLVRPVQQQRRRRRMWRSSKLLCSSWLRQRL